MTEHMDMYDYCQCKADHQENYSPLPIYGDYEQAESKNMLACPKCYVSNFRTSINCRTCGAILTHEPKHQKGYWIDSLF